MSDTNHYNLIIALRDLALAKHSDLSLADEAADEIIALRKELENEQARGVHSCHPNCAKDGCVNRRLRIEIAALQQELTKTEHQLDTTLAEVKMWRAGI
jgi:hypothetical protein